MWTTVLILIVMVQVIQTTFNYISKRLDKRLDAGARSKAFDQAVNAEFFLAKFKRGGR